MRSSMLSVVRAVRVEAFLGGCALVLCASSAVAQNKTWTGTTGLFNVAGNWTPSGVPSGNWTYIMNGGTVQITPGMNATPYGLYMGSGSGTSGTIEMTGGTLQSTGPNSIGYNSSSGTFVMSGGSLTVGAARQLQIRGNHTPNAPALFSMTGGTARLSNLYVNAGAAQATFTMNGSAADVRVNALEFNVVGPGSTAVPGTVNLIDGTFAWGGDIFVAGSVGSQARFALNLGNAETSPTFSDVTATGANLQFYATAYPTLSHVPNVDTVIQGWGVPGWTGKVDFGRGRFIADGWGGSEDRTLDLTTLGTGTGAPGVVVASRYHGASVLHRAGAATGWYAQNGAMLKLPALAVASGSNSYVWGDDMKAGTSVDLINSVALDFHNVTTAGLLDISLLAPERSELGTTQAATAAANGLIRGVWHIEPLTSVVFGTVDLSFRYDNVGLTLPEQQGLNLFKTVDGEWVDVSTLPGVTFNLDTTNYRLSVSGLNSFSYFALGTDITGTLNVFVPEPSTLALLALAGLALAHRRRRGLATH